MTAIAHLQAPFRTRVLALLIAIPAVTAALGVSAIDVWRAREPDAPLFATPFVYSLADAIAGSDIPRAYAFIREGQDPNTLITVRHPVLTGGRVVPVPPLLWAVALQNKDAVRMLIGFGARMDDAMTQRTVCLAARLGDQEMVRLLRMYGRDVSTRPCAAADEAL